MEYVPKKYVLTLRSLSGEIRYFGRIDNNRTVGYVNTPAEAIHFHKEWEVIDVGFNQYLHLPFWCEEYKA